MNPVSETQSIYTRYLDQSNRLDNGITYWVQQNKTEQGSALLNVVLNVGSMDEELDQQGLAHFVEHIAFQGTDSYAPGEIQKFLSAIGVQFGPDLNASTDHCSTIFKIKIPTSNPEHLETAVKMLFEMVFRMRISQHEVDKERTVILEELRQGKGLACRISTIAASKLFDGALHPAIGTEQAINSYTAADLQRFYDQYYRHPELVGVFAAGDFDVAQMQKWISTYFGQAKPAAMTKTKKQILLPHKPLQVAVVKDRECPMAHLHFCKARPAITALNDETLDRGAHALLAKCVSNYRFSLIEQNPTSALLLTKTPDVPEQLRGVDLSSLKVIPKPGKIVEAIKDVIHEWRKISSRGVSDDEFTMLKSRVCACLSAIVPESIPLKDIVSDATNDFLYSPRLALKDYDVLVQKTQKTTSQDVSKEVNHWYPTEDSILMAICPENDQSVTEELLSSCVQKFMEDDLSDCESTRSVKPLAPLVLQDVPTVERTQYPEIGTTEIRLPNGICIALKPIPDTNFVHLHAVSTRGLAHLPAVTRLCFAIAMDAANITGITGCSPEDATFLFPNSFFVFPKALFSFDGATLETSFAHAASDHALMILYRKLSDLRFIESEQFAKNVEALLDICKTNIACKQNDSEHRLDSLITAISTQEHPISQNFTLDHLKSVTVENVREAYRSIMSYVTDFKFSIVGNFTLSELEPLVIKYLGNLTNIGKARDHPYDIGIQFPQTPLEKTVYFEKDNTRASYHLLFPLYSGQDLVQQVVTDGIIEIVAKCLVVHLRLDQRKIYTPSIRTICTEYPYRDNTMVVKLTASPQEIEQIGQEAYRLICQLCEPKLESALSDALNEVKTSYQTRQSHYNDPKFWNKYFEYAYRYNWPLDREKDALARVDAISVSQIQSTLYQMCKLSARVAIINYPESMKPQI